MDLPIRGCLLDRTDSLETACQHAQPTRRGAELADGAGQNVLSLDEASNRRMALQAGPRALHAMTDQGNDIGHDRHCRLGADFVRTETIRIVMAGLDPAIATAE